MSTKFLGETIQEDGNYSQNEILAIRKKAKQLSEDEFITEVEKAPQVTNWINNDVKIKNHEYVNKHKQEFNKLSALLIKRDSSFTDKIQNLNFPEKGVFIVQACLNLLSNQGERYQGLGGKKISETGNFDLDTFIALMKYHKLSSVYGNCNYHGKIGKNNIDGIINGITVKSLLVEIQGISDDSISDDEVEENKDSNGETNIGVNKNINSFNSQVIGSGNATININGQIENDDEDVETDEPKTDESETEEPETDESKTDESKTDESETEESETEEPETNKLKISNYQQIIKNKLQGIDFEGIDFQQVEYLSKLYTLSIVEIETKYHIQKPNFNFDNTDIENIGNQIRKLLLQKEAETTYTNVDTHSQETGFWKHYRNFLLDWDQNLINNVSEEIDNKVNNQEIKDLDFIIKKTIETYAIKKFKHTVGNPI